MAGTGARRRRWPLVLGIILAVLVIAVVVAVNRLDAFLLHKAQAEAATYSQKLGRPITIGDVHTKLFPRIGAQVGDVSIGAAHGEEAPLLQLGQVNVVVPVMPLLRSRGQDVQVERADITGLTVNVIRFPDGTTNVERLQDKLAEQQPKKPEQPQQPEEEKKPTDLSRIRVDRASLSDGTIRLLDRSGPKPHDLAINKIDIDVNDLRAGKPLTVALKAAVLAQAQNLDVKVNTLPLPVTLVPTPEKVALKLTPIDLAPLGPFLPKSVGLLSGRLQADWNAELGGAVPGGVGPTKLVGTIQGSGLKFAGAEGGKALDLLVDTDVNGDLSKGDLALNRFKLAAGPATITGKGKVQNLVSGNPRIEGLEVVGQGLDPAVLATYYPPLRKSVGNQLSGPIGLRLTGSGTQGAQALALDLDFTPVRVHVPDQLDKAAGAPMHVQATLQGAAATGGALKFNARADLQGVDLRPGDIVNKGPGQPMLLTALGTYRPATAKNGMRVDVSSMDLRVLDDAASGSASYEKGGTERAPTQTFALNLKSDRLDLDKLLTSSSEEERPNANAPSKGKAEKPAQPAPAKDPHRYDGYRGTVDLAVGALRISGRDLSNVRAHVTMVNDLITVNTFSTGLYGGTVKADGTSIHLGPAKPPFDAKVAIQNVQMGQALSTTAAKKALSGNFSGNIALQGVGYDKASLEQKLTGAINGDLRDGVFHGLDVVAAVTQPIAKALPFASKLGLADQKVTELGQDVPIGVTIQNGIALLKKPIDIKRGDSSMSFTGGVGLNGNLDLTGTVTLAPSIINKLTAGKVTPQQPIPVPLKLNGPAWAPHVAGLDVKPAVTAIVQQGGSALAGQLLGSKGKQLQQFLGGIGGTKPGQPQQPGPAQPGQQPPAQNPAQNQTQQLENQAAQEAQKRLKGLFGGH